MALGRAARCLLAAVLGCADASTQRRLRASESWGRRHDKAGVTTLYSNDNGFLGHLEVTEQTLGGGEYLRTLKTARVVQSEATFKCLKEVDGHGANCTLSKEPSPMERAYLRNTLAVPLAFSQGRHWHGRNNEPQLHLAVLGFGAGTVPMYALQHLNPVHVTAVDIDPRVMRVAQEFFGVPLVVSAQQFSVMADNPDKLVDRKCNHDGRICVRAQDGLDYLKGAPDESIDLLVVDCFGGDGEGPPWLNADHQLHGFVQEAKRTAEVILVNQADSGGPEDEVRLKSQRQIWLDGGFKDVAYYGFDDPDLKAVQEALCPGDDCGKWNRFMLITSDRSRTEKDALSAARANDKRLSLGSASKLKEVLKVFTQQKA